MPGAGVVRPGGGTGRDPRIVRGKQRQFGRMYREWPFFRATIDNAVLAVAKSNRSVFHRYVELAGDEPGFNEIREMIDNEWQRTEDAYGR